MKKSKIRILALCFAVISLLTLPINAITNASDYIHGYVIDVYTTGTKNVEVFFKVDATGEMTKIGASSIKIYEYPYSSQDLVCSKSESSTGMTASNEFFYSNTIVYTGKTETKYKVVTTIFAQDSTGSDSRTKTYYVST